MLLGCSVAIGSCCLAAGASFEQFRVWQAVESPELNYQPSRWDFNREVVIPRILVGALWGLYGTTGICAFWSAATLLKRGSFKGGHNKPDSGDALQRA